MWLLEMYHMRLHHISILVTCVEIPKELIKLYHSAILKVNQPKSFSDPCLLSELQTVTGLFYVFS